MALVTTFATTPLTSVLFPPWYQKKLAAWKRGEIDWDGNQLGHENNSSDEGGFASQKAQSSEIKRILVSLRLDSLPSLFTFVALLGGEKPSTRIIKIHPMKTAKNAEDNDDQAALGGPLSQKRPLEVHGLRMLELTERLSSVMKDSELQELSTRDPVVNAFHTFGQLNNVAVSGEVELVPQGSYSEALQSCALDRRSDMILLPWSESGSLSEAVTPDMSESTPSTFSNTYYNQFMTKFLDSTPCNAAILVNNGFGARAREDYQPLHRSPTDMSLRSAVGNATAPLVDRSHHIFFPFLGGRDDRVALRFVLRLAKNPNVTATILHVKGADLETQTEISQPSAVHTKDGHRAVTTTSQEVLSTQDQAFFTLMADSLSGDLESRVLFNTIETIQPLYDSVEQARSEVGLTPRNAGDLVVVGRSHGRRTANIGNEATIQQSLGSLAEALIIGNVRASVLVIQADVSGRNE